MNIYTTSCTLWIAICKFCAIFFLLILIPNICICGLPYRRRMTLSCVFIIKFLYKTFLFITCSTFQFKAVISTHWPLWNQMYKIWILITDSFLSGLVASVAQLRENQRHGTAIRLQRDYYQWLQGYSRFPTSNVHYNASGSLRVGHSKLWFRAKHGQKLSRRR